MYGVVVHLVTPADSMQVRSSMTSGTFYILPMDLCDGSTYRFTVTLVNTCTPPVTVTETCSKCSVLMHVCTVQTWCTVTVTVAETCSKWCTVTVDLDFGFILKCLIWHLLWNHNWVPLYATVRFTYTSHTVSFLPRFWNGQPSICQCHWTRLHFLESLTEGSIRQTHLHQRHHSQTSWRWNLHHFCLHAAATFFTYECMHRWSKLRNLL